MDMDTLLAFIKKEHHRLNAHYYGGPNQKARYTQLAKLMEELGELSEAILQQEKHQRKFKLKQKRDLAGEFADVILCTLILAQEMGVEIKPALKKKISKIERRVY